jgi:hypothetical protein
MKSQMGKRYTYIGNSYTLLGNIRHEYQSQNHLIKPSISGCSKFRRGVVKNTRGVVNFDWGVVMYQNRSPNTLFFVRSKKLNYCHL